MDTQKTCKICKKQVEYVNLIGWCDPCEMIDEQKWYSLIRHSQHKETESQNKKENSNDEKK
jgi:hypothetical protein